MAQVKNVLLENASGKIGDFVLRRVRGKIIIASRPRPSGRSSTKQLAIQNRFASASSYAKEAMEDPALYDRYAKGVKGKLFTPRLVAIKDFLNPPVIHDIDVSEYHCQVGDIISIRATDDFRVTCVRINILSDGMIINTGDAVQDQIKLDLWHYTATTPLTLGTITLQISAFDTAGNVTTQEKLVNLTPTFAKAMVGRPALS